jgi:hypothetical protein
LHLTVSRIEADASAIVLDGTYSQHKLEGHGEDYYSEIITFRRLQPGHYRARIVEMEDVPALQDVSVLFDVHVPGHPK